MKKNLVTTLIEETFDNNSLNILLGAWCNPSNSNSELYKNSEVFDYHWNNSKKIETDYDYLYRLHEKTIKHLTIYMNKTHEENQSERYWRIIIGPWLVSQTAILWDRWELLREVFEKLDIDTTKCLKYKTKNLIPSDYFEFSKFRNEHEWNHIIFSKIIEFNYSSKIETKIVENRKKENTSEYKVNYYHGDKVKINYFIKFLDFLSKPFSKGSKIILYESYFGFINKILLSLSLGEVPRAYSEFSEQIKMPKPKERDDIKFTFEAENKFENFYKKMLFKLMPISYLEGYKLLLARSKKINSNVKVIFTATGYDSNDYFKIWTAKQTMYGKKYLISDHGAVWEKEESFGLIRKTADLFLTWNQHDFNDSIQVPINIDLKKKNFLRKNKGNKILLLANNTARYCVRLQTGPIAGQILEDYQLWKIFTQKLLFQIKKNLIFRPHPLDDWNLAKRYSIDFGEKYITNKKNFKEDLNRSKIIINTSLQTTFYQSMKTGIPTIILFNRKTLNMDPKLLKLQNSFLENKIFFKNPHEASKHINEIWDNPLEWWNSKKILELRNLFSEYCSIEKEDNLSYWKKLLKNQINGQIK